MTFRGHRRSNTILGVWRNDGDGETILHTDQSYHWTPPQLVELGRRFDLRDTEPIGIDNDDSIDSESTILARVKNVTVKGPKIVAFSTKADLRIIDSDTGSGTDLIVPLRADTLRFSRSDDCRAFVGEIHSLIHAINVRVTPHNRHLIFPNARPNPQAQDTTPEAPSRTSSELAKAFPTPPPIVEEAQIQTTSEVANKSIRSFVKSSFKNVATQVSEVTIKSTSWNQEQELGRIEASRTSQTKSVIQHFLFAHGDASNSLELTKKVLDELLTDFITETCFEAHRSAQLAGRQKIKLDDIKFACRKNPSYLGKIQETLDKKAEIDAARKLLDQNDDKITKSNVKALEEEPLNDADDDLDAELKIGSRSTSVGFKR